MEIRSATRKVALGLVVGASALAIQVPAGSAVAAGELPEMCSGRSDPSLTINAHANGEPKYILNLSTDDAGRPTGALVVGRSADRIYVDEFCRFWQHLPGQEPGGDGRDGGDSGVESGATVAHAVGIGSLADGTRVLVRTDVRATDEGMFYRLRYRVMDGHGETSTTTEMAETGEVHEDDAWSTVPAEGWARLDLLKFR